MRSMRWDPRHQPCIPHPPPSSRKNLAVTHREEDSERREVAIFAVLVQLAEGEASSNANKSVVFFTVLFPWFLANTLVSKCNCSMNIPSKNYNFLSFYGIINLLQLRMESHSSVVSTKNGGRRREVPPLLGYTRCPLSEGHHCEEIWRGLFVPDMTRLVQDWSWPLDY